MADNTSQGASDLIATDELVTINGSSVAGQSIKAQRVKPGYGVDGDFTDVSIANGLPVESSQSTVITQTISSLAATATIDCTGFSWCTVQMSPGYSGMSGLTAQVSNDGSTWTSLALCQPSQTSTGITTAMSTSASMWHGPLPARYLRFNPAGTYVSGSCVLTIYLTGLSLVMNSQGVSASLSSISGGVAPAIGTGTQSIGTATGNAFQIRASSSADQAAASVLAGVSGQMPYITGIHTSVHHTATGATPRRFQLVAAANALIEQNLVCPGGDSYDRMFRNPWKPMSATNNALNLAVTSIGAATGTWDIVIEGYYQTS